MKQDSLGIALVQMTAVDSLEANLSQFETIFKNIEQYGASSHSASLPSKDSGRLGHSLDLVCFPENCLFMRIKSSDAVEGFELSHPAFTWIGEWAQRLKVRIHLGSIPLIIDGKLFNSSIWLKEDGSVQVGYQKLHLFDITLRGQTPIRESDVFTHGESPLIHEYKGWKIGESICYDLRFSELYSYYAKENVDLILVPAAFLDETGKAHWEILLRVRAIESQCYVVASAQTGVHRSVRHSGQERRTHGKSMIVEPWGSVELNLGVETGVQFHWLQKDKINQVRTQIPMASHRRMHSLPKAKKSVF